ncbi:hypothetical protein SARC_10246 [Sphaeroforma arctica JP610]|uniref:PDZ domain-containing protein n=1 Tax=Sphaeroforma arctica JP610 TaxID=667725 RepID=A0A0L0FLC3_9EUKA|nr:hypothetical protein SARC_10246 [Sphaeroforma arctica JP610]KNC77291.1 hypothetical protein SARC_10246 [Sphaeroforma arctica JP610]|eukprot:XP_014151193.1 hypothetical protein SARC_10246 [Sphaeroforma arctica JP610]
MHIQRIYLVIYWNLHTSEHQFYTPLNRNGRNKLATMTVANITEVGNKLKDFEQETKRLRTIELKKAEGISFGATLLHSQGRVYVAYISKHRADILRPELSPAYMAGLEFGDEITQINGRHVVDMGSLDDVYATLDAASEVVMDVNEKSKFACHELVIQGAYNDASKSVEKKNKALSIGLDFNRQSVIVRVDPNQSAFLAGIKAGRMVVSVGDNHVVCSHPKSVIYVLNEAKRKINTDETVTTQTLEVWTAPAAHLQLLYALGNEEYQKVTSSEYLHDFNFALDEGFDIRQAHDKNTSIMTQLTRRTSPLSVMLTLLNDL